jgi:hypothetical protein
MTEPEANGLTNALFQTGYVADLAPEADFADGADARRKG